jgi:hypothetical protein
VSIVVPPEPADDPPVPTRASPGRIVDLPGPAEGSFPGTDDSPASRGSPCPRVDEHQAESLEVASIAGR